MEYKPTLSVGKGAACYLEGSALGWNVVDKESTEPPGAGLELDQGFPFFNRIFPQGMKVESIGLAVTIL